MTIQRIAVLGGGAWGTALALTCARAGRQVTLWEHEPGNAANLEQKRESKFLPGVRLDNAISVTRDIAEAAASEAILLVVPAQAVRSVAKLLAPAIAARTPLIACAKGIEHGTHKFMTEIIAECAPKAVPAILIGAELCRRCGARTADRRHDRGNRCDDRGGSRARSQCRHVPPLSFE